MNILITGIYGFLGSNLANELQKDNCVIGFYNQNKKNKINQSIETFDDLELIEFSPEIIVMCHAAVVSGQESMSKNKLLEVNVSLTKKIMEHFPLAKCIYVSSVSVYGNTLNEINEDTIVNPVSEYAKSKYLGEQIVLKGTKNIIVRLPSLYGSGMKENTLIPNYCNQAIDKNVIEVWGKGERLQNYIHVDDVVDLIIKIINYQNEKSFIALGVSDKEFSNYEVATIISNETKSEIIFVNEDTSHSVNYNNKKTKKTFNWMPVVALNEGIKNYIGWKKTQ
ncbi:NAD(P)-dependent oxidoreductase [Flavobacterium ovatum]|uniref:NAD-dependent epimerase/dehydratase family protein n=1 Tax=Flavobacterium ovatum TaxID=1928857 RepID=UPI00344C4AD7